MADERENDGIETSGGEQNLQTLDALHLDGKGAPTLEDADERSLDELENSRSEDVTANANVQSADRTTFERMVDGGLNEQPVVPTGDNVVVDPVAPTARDNNVDARFDNVQPRFNGVDGQPQPERRPEEREQPAPQPETLVSRDPEQTPRGEAETVRSAAAAPAAQFVAAPEDVVQQAAAEVSAPTTRQDLPETPRQADEPSVVAIDAVGTEDRDTKLDLRIATADRDGGSERITAITISDVPDGFTFVNSRGEPVGTHAGGVWSFSSAEIRDLYLRQPGDYSGDITLTVSATSSEANGSTATSTVQFGVHVEAVADAPDLRVADTAGMENTLIPLSITVGNNDDVLEGQGANAPETQTVYISNLPAGATLYVRDGDHPLTRQVGGAGLDIDGTHIPADAYVVNVADLPYLLVRSAGNDSHDFALNVWATSTEASNGDVAVTGFQTIQVDVGVNAPGASGSGTGLEDGWADLHLSANVNFPDGSENLRVFIADLPSGAVLAYANGTLVPRGEDGRFEVTGHLNDVKVGWAAAHADRDITFNLVAEVRDGDTDQDSESVRAAAPDFASTTVPVTVTVQAVADGPATLEASAIGVEDKWFALDITTGLIDTDGSETLSVTVTGPAGFKLAAAGDTDHPYTGVPSADGATVTYTLTQAQLADLRILAAKDSDTDFDLHITATTTEHAQGDGQIAQATSSSSIDINVRVLSDADKPVVSVIKDTQAISEDGLFDLSKSLTGTFNDGHASHAAVSGAATETDSVLGASASHDGSETITYRITANQDSRISLDGGTSRQDFHAGQTIEVSAADIASGKVQLGGVADWASSADHPTLTFTVVTVATEANAVVDDALETAALARDSVRVSDPAVLTITVDPVADAGTARLAVVASGYEDGLAGYDHAAGATGDGIAVVPTLTLSDADLSETPTGTVVITSSDAAMIAGRLTVGNGAEIVREDVKDAHGTVVSSTWTITGGHFTNTADNTFRLDGLSFHPAANSDADPVFDLSVQFQDTNGGAVATVFATNQTISVTAVADTPVLTVRDAAGWESASGFSLIPLDVSVSSVDTDGSETLYVYLTDLPADAGSIVGANVTMLTDGSEAGLAATAGNPVYKVPAADLGSLQLRVVEGYSTDVVLKVVSTAAEQDGGDLAISDAVSLRVDIGVLDPAITGTFAVSGDEDTQISLSSVSVAVTAPGDHESRTVYVEAPSGVTLYDRDSGGPLQRVTFTDAAGQTHSGFDVTNNLTPAGALNVTAMNDAAHSDANFELKVYAIVTDSDADAAADAGGIDLGTAYGDAFHDTAQSVATIKVTVNPVTDLPDAVPTGTAVGVEDKWVSVHLSGAALVDTDGSETLSVTLSDVPAGLTLESSDPDVIITQVDATTWTIGPAASTAQMKDWLDADLRLTGLDKVQPDQANTFTMKVSATATDISIDDTVTPVSRTTGTSDVVVTMFADADTPVVDVLKGATAATAETVGEDGLYNLRDVIKASSGEDPGVYGVKSVDGSETLTFKLTVPNDCVVKVGDTTYEMKAGGSLDITAQDIAAGRVLVGGVADWASRNAADVLRFDLTPIATESDAGASTAALDASNALDDSDLSRSGTATGETKSFYLHVDGVADKPDAPTATAVGVEDKWVSLHISNVALKDTDGSETLTVNLSDVPAGASVVSANPDVIITQVNATTWKIGPAADAATMKTWLDADLRLTGLDTARPDSDVDFSIKVSVTATEIANGASSTSDAITVPVTVYGDADTPVVDVLKGATAATAETVGEDGLYNLRDVIKASSGEDPGVYGVKSADGSETLTFKLTVPNDCVVKVGDTTYEMKAGGSLDITAQDIAAGKVLVGGVADWASRNAADVLRFDLTPIATESDAGASTAALDASNALDDSDLSRSGTATGETKSFYLHVDGVADKPDAPMATAVGVEDKWVSLHIADVALKDTDGSETLTVNLSDVPAGASVVSANPDVIITQVNATTWKIGPAADAATMKTWLDADLRLTGLDTARPDSDVDFSIKVSVTATEIANGASSTSDAITVPVTVYGDADTPVVDVLKGATAATAETVGEDGLYNLRDVIKASSGEDPGVYGVKSADGSETLTFKLTVPNDCVVKVGNTTYQMKAGGSLDITAQDIAAGRVLVGGVADWASRNAADVLRFDLTPIATESDAGASTAALDASNALDDSDLSRSGTATGETKSFYLHVDGVADKPDAPTATAVGVEDKWVSLHISNVALKDTDGSETLTVTIGDVPTGLTLVSSNPNAIVTQVDANTWKIGPAADAATMKTWLDADLRLTGLDTARPDSDADFNLKVSVTATETSNGATATSNVATVAVNVYGDADTPTVVVQQGYDAAHAVAVDEDAFYSLKDALRGYSGEDADTYAANLAQAYGFQSKDASETLSFRIDVTAKCRISVNGSVTDMDPTDPAHKSITVKLADILDGKVSVAGAANWASGNANDLLQFLITPIATEADAGASSKPLTDSNKLDDLDLSRSGTATGAVEPFYLYVTPKADTSSISVSASGLEDAAGIPITPTITLDDKDTSEHLQGTVDIMVRCDGTGGFPGDIAFDRATMVDAGLEIYQGVAYHVFKIPVAELAAKGGGSFALNGLTFVPDADSDLDIQYRIRVTTQETANSDSYVTVSSESTLAVSAVADAPILAVGAPGATTDAAGVVTVHDFEDGGADGIVRLNLAAHVKDGDGSEVLTNAELRDVPKGWGVIYVDANGNKVGAATGTDPDGDGKYTFALDTRYVAEGSAVTVALVPPANSDVDAAGITFWAKSTELPGAANPNDRGPNDNQVAEPTAETSVKLNVQLTPVADTPTLHIASARGSEDTTIALDVRASVTDLDESAQVEITNVPDGGVLSYIDANGHRVSVTFGAGGVSALTISPAEARTLTFTPPEDASGTYGLTVRAISTDGDPENPALSDVTSRTATLEVTVKGVNDDILDQNGQVVNAASGNLTASGTEDAAGNLVSLRLGDYSVDDIDHSEALSAVIGGIPAGFSLVIKTEAGIVDTASVAQYIGKDANGGSVWSVSEEYLKYVYVKTPHNYAGDVDLSVRLVTTEADGAATAIDKILTVHVEAVADAPGVVVSASTGEDGWGAGGIPVAITAAPTDTTTESPEHVTRITIDLQVPDGIPAGTLKLQLGDQVVTVGAGTEFTISEGDPLWSHYNPATGTLSGVTLLGVPNGWSADIPLTVTATSVDINGTTATTTSNASVAIHAVADAPTWTLGTGATGIGATGGIPDVVPFPHDISNVVLYIETADGGIEKVRIESFEAHPVKDPNYLDLDGYVDAHYPGGHLVGFTTKAGSNAVYGTSEGPLTVVDSRYSDANLPMTAHENELLRFDQAWPNGLLTTPNNTGTDTVWTGAGTVDQAVDLGLNASLTDPDGSESIYFIVSGVPNGVVLNHGYNNGDGTWTVLYAPGDATWKLTATSHYSGAATLTVTPVVVDHDPDGGTDTKVFDGKTFNLVVTDGNGGVGDWPTGTATGPALSGTPLAGTEDTAFGLGGVTATAGAGDTLSAVVLVSLPAGAAVLSTTDAAGHTIAWFNPVSNTWTIDPAHVADFKVQPPADYAGTFSLDLRAVAVHGTDTASTTGTVNVVTLAPVTDGASISGTVGTATEDGGAVPLSLTLADRESQNFSETLAGDTLTVTIAKVRGVDGADHLPGTLQTGTLANGAVVTAGADGTYTIKLTAAQVAAFATGDHKLTLDGLSFVPDANFSGQATLTVTASVQDTGTDTRSFSGNVGITVSPAVDATTYTAGPLAGKEDTGIALDVTINHQDLAGTGHWGSETASVVISGVPAGARIEGATNNGPTTVNGVTTYSWTVDRSSTHMTVTDQGITLKGVKYWSPTDDSSDVQLTVTTYVFEKGGTTPVATSQSFTVTVDGVTDGATINPNNASGREDELVAVDLGAQLVDVTGSSELTSIVITGVPAGASFCGADGHVIGSAGPVSGGTCTWTFTEAQVASLGLLNGGKVYFLGAVNVAGAWTLTAQAFTTDHDGTSAVTVASNALPFTVTVAAVADAPVLTASPTVTLAEDGQEALGIHAALVDLDSESLTVTITGAPDGSLIRVNTGTVAAPVWTDIHGQNGVWTIPGGTAASLDNLYVKPPANYNGSFTLNVAASAVELTGGAPAWNRTDDQGNPVPTTIQVTVTAVNDAPTMALSSSGVGIENGVHTTPITLLKAADSVTFSDVDFADAGAAALLSKMTMGGSGLKAGDSLGLSGLPVTLAADGSLVTHPDANTTVAIRWNATTHTLTFSGNATPAQYAELARHVVISSPTGTLVSGTRDVAITAYDLAGAPSTAASGVTVTVTGTAILQGAALGDVQFGAGGAVTLPAGTLSTVEDAAPIGLGLDMATATAADVAVTIAGMPAGTVLRDAAGTVLDSAHLTAGDLAGLKVDLPDNWNGSATLTVTAHAGATTMTEQVTVTAAAVNDAPQLTLSQTVSDSHGAVSSPLYVVPHDATVGITDVDSTVISGMTVQLLPDAHGQYAVGDTLGLYGHDIALNQSCQMVVKDTGILVSYDAANHTLSFSGNDSAATYADLAKSVVLSNTGAMLSTGERAFNVTLYDDGHAASQTVTTSVDVTAQGVSSVALGQDAHGSIYWNGATPVLNGNDAANTFQISVGTDWTVDGNGGTDLLMLNGPNGGWTFELNATDHLVHVVSTTDPSHSGVIHLEAGATIQPFANGAHDVVFNGSASGTIDFGADHTVTFENLEKIHG